MCVARTAKMYEKELGNRKAKRHRCKNCCIDGVKGVDYKTGCTESFICFDCKQEISDYCPACHTIHAIKEHGRKEVSYAKECRYCGKLIRSPGPPMIRAYLWHTLGERYGDIGIRLGKSAKTIKRWCRKVKKLYLNCSFCGKRVLWNDDEIQVAFLYGFEDLTQEATAILLNKSLYQVRKIVREFEEAYDFDFKLYKAHLKSTKAFIKNLVYIGDVNVLDALALGPTPVRHPMEGYSYTREPEGGEMMPGTGQDDRYRKTYAEFMKYKRLKGL